MPKAKKEDAAPPPPLCVWCNAPWTDDMMDISAHVETENGYYGETYIEGAWVDVDITCSTCQRLVYRKQIRCSSAQRYW